MNKTFPVITKSLQEAYEQGTKGSQDKTPELCGYYGRACRQLEKQEGANKMLCMGCGLAYYSMTEEQRTYSKTEDKKKDIVIKQIWTKDIDEHGMLVDVADIEQIIPLHDITVYGIDGCNIDAAQLNDAKEKYGHISDQDDLEGFFKQIQYNYKVDVGEINIETCGDEETPSDDLVFDVTNQYFSTLKDFNEVPAYRYWDGSNWKTIWADDYCSVSADIEIDKDSRVSLDEWDGHNFVTGGVGLHQCFYKIISLDGEPVEDQYLLIWSSQWQGVQDEAEVMNIEELKTHIEELGRKVEEYL